MSFTIPESLTRLQITTFVEGAELANLSRSEIIREGSKKMAEQALRDIINKCIISDDYNGYQSQTLKLDCIIMSPKELNVLIADAIAYGKETMRKEM